MRGNYPKKFYVTGFMIASLLAGAIFFVSNHLDFIIAAFEHTKFNLPNICYAIIRLFTSILIPTTFVAPSLFQYSRIRITKISFWILGILHLLTTTWIFYFFAAGYTFSDLFSSETITFFQMDISNAFVSAQVFWDSYELISVLLTLILSGLYFTLGVMFDDNRIIVRWLCVGLVLYKILTPILYNLIVLQVFPSSFWLTNNFVEFVSMIAFTIGIFIASIDDETWTASIWDEELFSKANPDDEE